GLESVAQALRRALPGRLVLEAYNQFCAPSLEEALEDAAARGARQITLITTMYTRGGIHSESEIPAIVAAFRRCHPDVDARYCWPFDEDNIAAFLAQEIARAERRG
ncbi:MAG: CbiX/SirB N-terminal domain-containing protein, partial [Elusimicrobia bacterium]|nr:CbiX/SirB N-terminal domain-containing protein [Elusimicrobiota bacterium]